MSASVRKSDSPVRAAKPAVKKTAGRGHSGAKAVAKKHSAFGLQIIDGLNEIIGTLETGGLVAVEKKFTVRRVKMATFEKPALGKAGVLAIRNSLGTSQTVFANLLGVSVAAVRAWEQGVNEPSGIALRFLAEIRANPDYWKARLKEASSS